MSAAVKDVGPDAETATMRRIRPASALAVAAALVAASMVLAGCASGSGPAQPSASDASLPLASPSPANPALAAMLLTPKDLPTGWQYAVFDGVNGLPARACDTGAEAVAKVGLASGLHVVVEDGTLFDTAAHASAFLRREAHGQDCARSATAAPVAQTPLGLAPLGDESYSLRSEGTSCDDRILFRKGTVVLELVTPCTETSASVAVYVDAAVKAG